MTVILLFEDCYINGIIQHMTFAEWRFWLSVNSLKTHRILFSVPSILLLNPFIEGFFFLILVTIFFSFKISIWFFFICFFAETFLFLFSHFLCFHCFKHICNCLLKQLYDGFFKIIFTEL